MKAPPTPLSLGPWKGVRDVGDAGMQDPAYLQDCINGLFMDAENGGDIVARPGFERITGTALEGGSPIQGFYSYQHTDGRWYTFAFCNGKVFRRTAATAWTDVSPAGITISATAFRIWAIPYNSEMIVNDGVNEPWRGTSLTSSPITGTEIEINTAGAAWVARGKPTVHGGKLFFVVHDIGGTKYVSRQVWSEEAAAATGYLQDTYTNSWDLIQAVSPAERLLAVQGTNAGEYYFRPFSIGIVYGAVNSEFSTASTHDGISSDVGLFALDQDNADPPSGLMADVCVAKDYLWFLDSTNRPCRLRLGSKEIDPLWQQFRNDIARVRDFGQPAFSGPQIAYSADLDKVAVAFLPRAADATTSSPTGRVGSVHIFNATTGNYEGRWAVALTSQNADAVGGIDICALGTVHRSDAFANQVGVGASVFIVGTTDGHIYQQTAHEMSGWSSVSFGDNALAMHMSATTHLAPNAQRTEYTATELNVEAFPDSGTLSVDRWTPQGQLTTLTPTGITGTDSIQSSHDHGIYRVGLLDVGRWLRYVLHWNVPAGSTPYGFERAQLVVSPKPTIGTSK